MKSSACMAFASRRMGSNVFRQEKLETDLCWNQRFVLVFKIKFFKSWIDYVEKINEGVLTGVWEECCKKAKNVLT